MESKEITPIPRVEAISGQPLKNVNIYAGQNDPIALPDDAYPHWVNKEVDRPAKLDPERFKKLNILPTRTELRLLNKRLIRQSNAESSG